MPTAGAVTVIPVSEFPAADPLDGTEIVPVVQDGASKRTTAQDIADLGGGADVAEGTVQGRALGDGTGPVETLTGEQVSDIVWDAFDITTRETNDVGYLVVEPGGIAAGNFTQQNSGKGLIKTTAGVVAMTIDTQANEPIDNGTVITVACTHAGGTVTVTPAGGVTLINFGDGTTGVRTLTGIGIFTLWKLSPDVWGIHGSTALT